MSRGEYAGHAMSAIVLVVGGMFVKSAILNWVVGPLIATIAVVAATSMEERLRGRGRRP